MFFLLFCTFFFLSVLQALQREKIQHGSQIWKVFATNEAKGAPCNSCPLVVVVLLPLPLLLLLLTMIKIEKLGFTIFRYHHFHHIQIFYWFVPFPLVVPPSLECPSFATTWVLPSCTPILFRPHFPRLESPYILYLFFVGCFILLMIGKFFINFFLFHNSIEP
jgi:hypothetical protein